MDTSGTLQNAHNSTKKSERSSSLWNDAWRRLKKNRLSLTSAYILLGMMLLTICVPWVLPYSYETQDLELGAVPPGTSHLLGTDVLGRDMLTRILYGGRISLSVGALATIVSLFIGVLWGTVAAYFGGRVDTILMRLVDIFYALPFIVFVILLMVVFGRNLFLLFAAIGAVEWLTMARVVRGQVLTVKQQTFIEAAVAMGVSRRYIIYRHVIPNVLGPVIIYTTLTIPNVMLLEAFLSFLGLGVQPPMSSWGLLIAYGVENMEEYPWLLIFPGLFFSVTLFALNFLGDGLRDALDAKGYRE